MQEKYGKGKSVETHRLKRNKINATNPYADLQTPGCKKQKNMSLLHSRINLDKAKNTKKYMQVCSLSSNHKKVILSKGKETKRNKTFDIVTPFSLTQCVFACAYAYVVCAHLCKNKPKFFSFGHRIKRYHKYLLIRIIREKFVVMNYFIYLIK